MHNHEHTQQLLLRIVRAIIERTEDAKVRFETIPRLTQWYIQVHGEDQGKVRGRKAAHIIALQYIIQLVGIQHDETQRVTLLDTNERFEGHRSPLRRAEQYNPLEALELLQDTLACILQAPFSVDVTSVLGAGLNAYTFHITTSSAADQKLMLEAHPNDPHPAREDMPANTLIGALGTLWRAYASREGVTFKISIDSRD